MKPPDGNSPARPVRYPAATFSLLTQRMTDFELRMLLFQMFQADPAFAAEQLHQYRERTRPWER